MNNKAELIIFISIIAALYAIFIIVYLILLIKEVKKSKRRAEIFTGGFIEKKKKRLSKTYYKDKYNELLNDNKQLSEQEDKLRDTIQEIKGLINSIKILKIDLVELEELGLQRYNAKYGKRLSDNRWTFRSTFISEDLYEELIRYGFVNQLRLLK